MVPRRRLILWFTLGWAVCGTLATLALRAQLALGSMRMSQPMTGWRLVRMQAPGWLAVALLTPVVVAIAARLRPGEGSWGKYLGAHVALLVAFVVADATLSVYLTALVNLASDLRLGFRTIAMRGASGVILSIVKYVVIVAGTEAARFFHRARAEAEERERLSRQALQLERDLTSARLSALRQQLQPHFLFNALNAASGLIDESPAAARELIARLADLLRLSLSRGDAPQVTLGEELDFTDRYLAVERARFGERLRVDYDVAGDTLGAMVPGFLLQPIVENAIRHGFARLPAGGQVSVSARREAGRLRISVRSDRPAGSAIGPEGVGLTQVRARLDVLHGAAATMIAHAPDASTFEVRIDLPAEPLQEDAA